MSADLRKLQIQLTDRIASEVNDNGTGGATNWENYQYKCGYIKALNDIKASVESNLTEPIAGTIDGES